MKRIKTDLKFEEALPYLREGKAISATAWHGSAFVVNEIHPMWHAQTRNYGRNAIESFELTRSGNVAEIGRAGSPEREFNAFRIKIKTNEGLVNKGWWSDYVEIMHSMWDVYELEDE